nr:hypothetical protein BgiMline_011754 [Biomphalaria glabrata]
MNNFRTTKEEVKSLKVESTYKETDMNNFRTTKEEVKSLKVEGTWTETDMNNFRTTKEEVKSLKVEGSRVLKCFATLTVLPCPATGSRPIT